MNTQNMNNYFKNAMKEVDRLASAINGRGYDDIQEDWDDYSLLMQTCEFRKLVTLELYEAYYLPKRHEHELQLLTQLVDAVASSNSASFLAGAAIGGVVGNTVYEMLKTFLLHVRLKFKKIKRTHDAVQEITKNLQQIQTYMCNHDGVRISQISSELDIETHKVEPLLKLLGCKSRQFKKHRVWTKPDTW